MEFIKSKVSFKRETDNYGAVYYDVTDQLKQLPNYIQSIEVCFDSYIRNEYKEDEAYIKEQFDQFFQENKIKEGRIQCNAEKVIVNFIDGYQIQGWNSEWGGMNFISPNIE